MLFVLKLKLLLSRLDIGLMLLCVILIGIVLVLLCLSR